MLRLSSFNKYEEIIRLGYQRFFSEAKFVALEASDFLVCQQGVEEPVWRWDGGFVIVTFKRPTVEASDDPSKIQVQPKQDLSTTQAGPKYDPSTTQVRKLIEIMPDGYTDMKEIMTLCGLKSLKRFRENYILPALKIGVIERLYPNQPNHPKQKYRRKK